MAPSLAQPGRRGTVLVVEGSPEIGYLIAATLAEDGLAVATATSGWEAALWLEGERPALVVEDVDVPFGGRALVLLLRGLYGEEVPLVALAGDAAAARAARYDRAAAVLSPPYDLDELSATVRRLVTAGAG